jgi:hypothetical protein
VITLQSYEVDEIVDALLECRDILMDGGFSGTSVMEQIERALEALGYNEGEDDGEDCEA